MPSDDDLHTLQLGPLWVLSALAGTHGSFYPPELSAFWDTVVEVSRRSSPGTRDILTSVMYDRSGLVLDFELDDRPVVSGLRHVVAALSHRDEVTAHDYKVALLRIGLGVARNRGPYGHILGRDEQTLLLLAALLDLDLDPGDLPRLQSETV